MAKKYITIWDGQVKNKIKTRDEGRLGRRDLYVRKLEIKGIIAHYNETFVYKFLKNIEMMEEN